MVKKKLFAMNLKFQTLKLFHGLILLVIAIGTLSQISVAQPPGYEGGSEPADPDSVFEDYTNVSSSTKGLDNFQSIERSYRLPEGYVLTGIGATAHNDNIIYLRVQGRPVNSDGSLGPRQNFQDGTIESSAPETWAEVDDEYVIIGFGGNVWRNNVNTLNVWYRRYNPKTKRLEGQVQIMSRGTNPNSGNNESFVRTEAVRGPDIDRLVLVGVGMNAYNDNLNRVSALVGKLRPIENRVETLRTEIEELSNDELRQLRSIINELLRGR